MWPLRWAAPLKKDAPPLPKPQEHTLSTPPLTRHPDLRSTSALLSHHPASPPKLLPASPDSGRSPSLSPSLLESSQGIREAKPPLPQSHPTSLYPPPPSPPPRFPLPLHLNLPHIALPPLPQLPLPPPSPQHPSSSTSLPRPTNSTPCQVLTYSPPSHNYHAPKPTPLPLFITPRATRAPSPLTTI